MSKCLKKSKQFSITTFLTQATAEKQQQNVIGGDVKFTCTSDCSTSTTNFKSPPSHESLQHTKSFEVDTESSLLNNSLPSVSQQPPISPKITSEEESKSNINSTLPEIPFHPDADFVFPKDKFKRSKQS